MTEYFTKDGDDYKKVEDTLLTQSSVNGIVEKRLEQQKRNEFGDYDELKEKAAKVETITTEYDGKLKTAGETLSAVEKERDDARLETVKVKVTHEFKLSDKLTEFLTGTDEKSIREQAEKLSKGVPGSQVVIDKDKKPEGKNSDTKEVAKNLFGPKSGE